MSVCTSVEVVCVATNVTLLPIIRARDFFALVHGHCPATVTEGARASPSQEAQPKTEKFNINNEAERRGPHCASEPLHSPRGGCTNRSRSRGLDRYEYDEFMEVIKVRSFIGRDPDGGGVKYAFESQPTARHKLSS